MSNEIIQLDNAHNDKGMTSLEIAEVTGKNHKEVLRDIRNLLTQGAAERNFAPGEYKDKNNQSRPMFNLTPKGCLILASGYNVILREKIIDKLDEYQQKERTTMTSLPNFSNPAEAARAWAHEYEQKMIEQKRADAAEQQVYALTQEIQTMQPKVSYYDAILNNKSTVLVTQIALDYGMSAKAFNKKLYELRIQHKVNQQWILYAPYIALGYMHSKPVEIIRHDGRKEIKYNSEWTQKGRLFLYDELKKHNIIPLIEQ